MSNRQFVTCTFKAGTRAYTYHWDGPEALAPGATRSRSRAHATRAR